MAVDDIQTLQSSHAMIELKTTKMEPPQTESKMDKTIHSGHFMVSRVHDVTNDEDETDLNESIDNGGYNFLSANKETSNTYHFGPRSTNTLAIDASLTKLFECMTLAYSGTITSPKWKPFRGMHLLVKDKIRLNNIIWREWHMQYIYGKNPIVCQFATPLSDDIHTKPEAVVLEGKYWKRRLDTVTAEYKKWRKYFKERIAKRPPDSELHEVAIAELLERVKDTSALPRSLQQQPSATDLLLTNDVMDMDFTDNFFAQLNQPFPFPNPRELSQLGCADLIQPGLVQLQPNLDEFMDIDSMHEMLGVRNQFNQSGSFLQNVSGSLDLNQANEESQGANQGPVGLALDPHISSVLTSAFSASINTNSLANLGDINFPLSEEMTPLMTGTQMSVDCSNDQFRSQNQNFVVPNVLKTLQVNKPCASEVNPVNIIQNASNLPVSSTIVSPDQASRKQSPQMTGTRRTQPTVGRSTRIAPAMKSSGQLWMPQKKDGFVIPVGKPTLMPRKQRSIAPAPNTTPSVSSPAVQSTYLAQLLTKGIYPGAINSVKKEPTASQSTTARTATSFQPIRPADNTLPVRPADNIQSVHTVDNSQTITQPKIQSLSHIKPTSVTLQNSSQAGIAIDLSQMPADFPTSVLLAAASQALGSTSNGVKDVLSMSARPTTQTMITTVTSLPESPPLPSVRITSAVSPLSPISDRLSPLAGLLTPGKPGAFCQRETEKVPYQDQRRLAHLSAEQKRRCNLKNGFDMLHTLVPALSLNPKVSKAAKLQKTADYCKKLKSERIQMQNEVEILKQEIESLNSAISIVQSQLPETGVPVTRQRVDQMKEMFEEYVRNRTLQNWKFWIFSIIVSSLFDSYNNSVSTASIDELCRTVLAWLDQNCSLVALRPTVLNALRHLSTTTSILTEPARVQEQATQAVTKGQNTTIDNTRT